MRLFVKEKYFYSTFFTIAITVTLQNLVFFSVSLADNIMLGSYSQLAISGVNLALQIQFLLQMLVMALTEGIVIVSSRFWGSRNIESIKKVLNVAFRIGLVFSVLALIVVFIWGGAILTLFTNEADIVAEGADYLKIVCFTYVFFTLTNVFLASLRSVEIVKIGFILACVILVVNVGLNYVLIFGHFGAPELGVKGAAIATLIAKVVEFCVLIIYLKVKDKRLNLKFGDLCRKLDYGLLRTYLGVTLPIVAANAFWGVGLAMQAAFLGHMGAEAIAANSIVTALYQIISVGIYGAISGSVVVLGKTLGEGDLTRFKSYAVTLQTIYFLIGLITSAVLLLLQDFILSFYVITPEAREITEQFLKVLAFTVVCTAYEFCSIAGIIRGAGNTRFMMYNDFFFMWLVVLPLSYTAAFVLQLEPVWVYLCLKIDQIIKCPQALFVVNRFRYIKKIEPDK